MFKRVLVAAVLLASSLSISTFAGPAPAQASNNGAADSPPRGWSNWSFIQRDPTEANTKAQAKAMHDTGLINYGYEYVNVDDYWYENPATTVDPYGRWVADLARFPKGMADIGTYVHSLGEKFGMYLTPGIPVAAYNRNTPIEGTSFHARDIVSDTSKFAPNYRRLGGVMYFIDYTKNPAAAQAFVSSWAKQLASWGVDYLKMDGVGPADVADVSHWSTALAQSGRTIYFGLANKLAYANAASWKQYANGWRINGDVDCYCPLQTNWGLIAERFRDVAVWAPYAGKGGWNDLDSLQIGSGDGIGLTRTERQSGMTLWAISAAPLLLGADLTNLDPYDLAMMTNNEVLAVNHAGIPATPVSQATGQQVWRSRNTDGSYTVALFNLGDSTVRVTADFTDLGFTGTAAVRDLWQRMDAGTADGFLSRSLPAHGSALFRVAPGAGSTFLGGSLTSARSGRCADLPRSSTVNTTRLDVWDCHGGNSRTALVWSCGPATAAPTRAGPSAAACASFHSPTVASRSRTPARSTFHRSGQAADDPALEQAEEDQRGDHRQGRERQDLGRVHRVLRREGLHAEGQREGRLPIQDEQRQEVAVPAGDEGQDAHGDDAGHGQREDHPPEEAQPAAAIDRRRLLDLVRDRPQERDQDDDRYGEREPDLREDHPGQGVHHADGFDQDVQRRDRHRQREHQTGGEQRSTSLHGPGTGSARGRSSS